MSDLNKQEIVMDEFFNCGFSIMYMLFTGWEVRIEKYFVEVSKTARGRRPRDVFETETKYFSIRTDLNGK